MHTEQLGNAQPEGVNAEGTQFDKQRKPMEMLANGDFFLCYLGLLEG